ncbi:hypothetical protein R5H30_17360 [Sulfitobacter sp. D35]|uniref:hypothetical protein n=1 Tax=Sulfitobacter sp. D35 TaxID=3083252 RepID=UPI00296EC0A9|nr:hypothetical protein [Sulfitobacter sp. D35]MDW4499765.1 hypothetical protein [Sulfitobacter sp. D35]
MTDPQAARAEALIAALPAGHLKGSAAGKPYRVEITRHAKGRSLKLVASQLGGPDRLSLNLYLTAAGPRLFPCETTPERVLRFLEAFVPDRRDAAGPK